MTPHLVAGGAALGAWWSHAIPVALLAGILVLAVWRRTALWMVLAALVVVSGRGEAAERGLVAPDPGPFDAMGHAGRRSPAARAVGVTVTVRYDGRRLIASAHGRVAGRLDDALAGERVRLTGTLRRWPPMMRGRGGAMSWVA